MTPTHAFQRRLIPSCFLACGLIWASTPGMAARSAPRPLSGMPAAPAPQATPSQCTEVAAASASKLDKAADKALAPLPAGPTADPVGQLQLLVSESARRSAEVGAAKLLAEAADFDVGEVLGSKKPQVTLYGNAALGQTSITGRADTRGFQGTAGVNVGASLYDGGRLESLINWRQRLADAAKLGQGATEERVALEAVSTALERHRFRMQAQIYQQYVRKMGCLVEALEQIVSEDKGRMSELVQARKSQQQAELQREQAISTTRQFDIRLRKLVGDQAIVGEGFSTPLMSTPNLDEVQRLVERSNDLQQMLIEVAAQQNYAQAVASGSKPQINWTMGKTISRLPGSTTNAMSVGVQANWSIYNGGSQESATKAALKRAEAARQSYQEALNSKLSKVTEQHDAAVSAFDRAKRSAEVLKDSDRVRNYTFQQWSQLGRRSLFDVMSAEGDHFAQRVAYINALIDGAQANASLRSQGVGLLNWMQVKP
jgi:adhesin transport system outer membrane protein